MPTNFLPANRSWKNVLLIGLICAAMGTGTFFRLRCREHVASELAFLVNKPVEILARLEGSVLGKKSSDWFVVPLPLHSRIETILRQPRLKTWPKELMSGIEGVLLGVLRLNGRDYSQDVSFYCYGKGTFCISLNKTVLLLKSIEPGDCGTELFLELEKATQLTN